MAIKVSFLTGATTATVSGLYQWDYGQVLEIECAELGSEIVEVHFACSNMSEAIVRTCAFTNGVGTVTIPDECLEQTSPVTAWVYKVDSTQGHTIKAITLPITARTRPSNTRSVPADYNDKYGQLIEEVNEAINAIENGNVTAANAVSATSAGHATTATSATNATYATSAGSAAKAGTISKYLHNVRLDLRGSFNGSDYTGVLVFQVVTASADAITMDNIANQLGTTFAALKQMPCSGYIKNATDGNHYVAASVGFSGIHYLKPTAFTISGESLDAGFALDLYTVAYDVVVQL